MKQIPLSFLPLGGREQMSSFLDLAYDTNLYNPPEFTQCWILILTIYNSIILKSIVQTSA